MSGAIVQERAVAQTAAASFQSLAFTNPVTAANTIHVGGSAGNGGAPVTFTFSDSVNTYNNLGKIDDTGNGQSLGHAIAPNIASGTPTVTTGFGAADIYVGIEIREISGVTTNPLDGHKEQLSAGATVSAAATNTVQPAFWSAISQNFSTTSTPAATSGTQDATFWGFTGDPNTYGCSSHNHVTTVGSQSANFSCTGATGMGALMVILTETSTTITGTAAITEGADSVSGTGSTGTTGAAAITEGADAVSGTGSTTSVSFQGALRRPGPGVSPYFLNQFLTRPPGYTATVLAGNAAITEGADTVSASGTTTTTGSAAITEGSDTVAGTGSTGTAGVAAITEGADTVAGVGAITTTGVASILEDGDIVVASGSTTTTGAAAIIEGLDSVAGTGFTGATGVAAITEDADIVSGTGSLSITGAAGIFEDSDIVAAFGSGGSHTSDEGGGHGRLGTRKLTLREIETALSQSEEEFSNPAFHVEPSAASKMLEVDDVFNQPIKQMPSDVELPRRYDDETIALLWMWMS